MAATVPVGASGIRTVFTLAPRARTSSRNRANSLAVAGGSSSRPPCATPNVLPANGLAPFVGVCG